MRLTEYPKYGSLKWAKLIMKATNDKVFTFLKNELIKDPFIENAPPKGWALVEGWNTDNANCPPTKCNDSKCWNCYDFKAQEVRLKFI